MSGTAQVSDANNFTLIDHYNGVVSPCLWNGVFFAGYYYYFAGVCPLLPTGGDVVV